MTDNGKALTVLTMNTVAFVVCFACWMMNGVLVTFLVDNKILHLDKSQIGWLMGIPVLTGALMRLPMGVLTDKYGGRIVYALLMLVAAVPMYLTSAAHTFTQFFVASLGFGLSGASFAVGIAYTSVWFSKERQGTALGIFGMGNLGAALTSFGAPRVLRFLTAGGENLDGWRTLPKIYAAMLVVTAILFYLLTHTRKVEQGRELGVLARLSPLKHIRVWRFGLYYFFTFGGFVALAQWLIPYYVNVYAMSIATAGLMATFFNLPSGAIRALGGWMSDRWGARTIMYYVFGASLLGCFLLCVPKMDIQSPGEGVMADAAGEVGEAAPSQVVVGEKRYGLRAKPDDPASNLDSKILVLPHFTFWQEPVVRVGDSVRKRQLLARGVTHVYFQANLWIFTGLLFLLGIMMGIGNAAVYKYIPDYFPREVGVVGGIVGVLGALGGFFYPLVFGYLLKWTGIWTTCWLFLLLIALVCRLWLHFIVKRMMQEKAPALVRQFDQHAQPSPTA